MPAFRVVQVVLSLSPGGTERLVIDLVRRTRPRCESLVCCLDDEGAWADDLVREGVPVVALNRPAGFRPSLGLHIASQVRKHRATIVHCHHYSPFVYGRIAAALTGAALVFTEHGRLSDHAPSAKRRLVNPWLGRLGGDLFAVSHDLRAHMIAEGFPAARVGVIHNGIDPGPEPSADARARATRALDLPADALTIAAAGRLDAVKDFANLLAAFGELGRSEPAARLVIFGDGPERNALSSRAMALGISARVTFTGYRDDVRDLLPAADVFVNSSISEGISLTILEAMAASLPVVATEVGGTPEVVVPGRTGLLVPARDPIRLAGAIAELAADRGRGRTWGAAGRERVLQHFTIDRMVADYVARYEHAVGGHA